ncbi:MAG: glycosyltransferase, partial [bacterium]|nr:glycosyltransferase [bacterium]
LTSTKQDASVANFGVYRTKVINAVLSMGDYIRYFPTMINWVGFSSKSIEVKHNERKEGKTSYSLTALLNLGINVIIAFSDRPLKLIIRFGIIICVFTSVVGVYLFVQYLRGSIIVTGWTSLILSIWFFSGLIISLIGAVSLYIGKIFEQVKARPRYIISEKTNF